MGLQIMERWTGMNKLKSQGREVTEPNANGSDKPGTAEYVNQKQGHVLRMRGGCFSSKHIEWGNEPKGRGSSNCGGGGGGSSGGDGGGGGHSGGDGGGGGGGGGGCGGGNGGG
uniref:Uncharacterized protein n=1 Tax=Kwoniella dejecticola CBS 10117 TaxID=1296121 RepID=A0A1A6A377_9TREE|nr:uncharacterized protein I303_05362 [Kwoniella dejecticola CBS 10117]OBR84504.1 hypothetical protein I303_05362 [Kwoniella dejecticola CBS 10117]